MKLKITLNVTPQIEVIKAIFAPSITVLIPSFINTTSPDMSIPDIPNCKPTNVPITPTAVRKPGTAAIKRLSVTPLAKVNVLKK